MSVPAWGGRKVTEQARPYIAARLPAPCGRCGKTVTLEDEWVVGHIKSRLAYPELTWTPSNWRPEHRACSDGTAGESIAEKALRDAGFSPQNGTQRGSALPVSLPGAHSGQFEIPEHLSWPSFVRRAPAWLLPHLEPDENSNPPLAVSPLHPEAVGSFALPDPDRAVCPEGAIAWIEEVEKKISRWWQGLGLILKLQHDAEGQLLKRLVVETGPRRAGKSVGLRGLALWRMEFGARLFGERQEIVHTGSDLAVCRKAQKEAWRWAGAHWGEKSVTRGNGKEAIETPDSDVWLVRAQDATYGWDTTLGLVDEGWDVKPDTVTEGLEPSLMGRQSPQLVMTSTSHRRARSTMRTALSTALSGDDPKTLLLWWGAPPGADPSDPAVWRAASPYWDEERAEFVASMYAKALAGEQDPELDDIDPMRGFECQYTNLWNLKERRVLGNALITAEAWAALAEPPDSGVAAATPDEVAVEAWFESGCSVARVWALPGGRALVSVTDHDDLAEAVMAAQATGCRRHLLVGASLVDDPALRGVRHRPVRTRTAQAVEEMARLLESDAIRHDGSTVLAEQITAVRTLPSADGVRIVSKHRADAIKAAAWAISAARARGVRRPMRVITANG